jgi:hypothetical protein
MSTHTPGPWTCKVATDNPYVNAETKTIYPSYVLNPTKVGTPAIPQDEAWANAQLIAAAPELLQACRDALFACVNPKLRLVLETAIAKAEGRR